MSWPITWWEYTGEYTPFVDNRSSPIMRNKATGEQKTWREMPFGACWDININARTLEREADYPAGADGCAIVCLVPGSSPPDASNKHHWHIDARARNCTLKDDDAHRCWVRHGTVGDQLTIDKAGLTCDAGAGSIQAGGWHGFLKNGLLYAC